MMMIFIITYTKILMMIKQGWGAEKIFFEEKILIRLNMVKVDIVRTWLKAQNK